MRFSVRPYLMAGVGIVAAGTIAIPSSVAPPSHAPRQENVALAAHTQPANPLLKQPLPEYATAQAATTHTHIDAGLYHSAARKSDGTIVCWGNNIYGQCNVPVLGGGLTYTDVKCGGRHTIGLVSDGTVRCWGANTFGPGEITVPAFGALTAVKIEAGEMHTLAVMSDGTILTWGYSASNLGTVATLPAGKTWTNVAGGANHSVGLRSDGVLVGWGANDQGQASPPSPFGVGATVGLYLGYIDLATGVSDGGRDYWLTLDRRVSDTTSGVSIAAAAGVTTVTVPYISTLTRYIGTVTGLNTFTVAVNLTGLAFVAGKKYTSTHSFHKPEVQISAENGRRLILDSTSSALFLELRYEDTGYFKVVTGNQSKEVGSSTVFTPAGTVTEPNIGMISTGVFARLDSQFDCSVQNDTPFPHTLVSGEWIMSVTKRSPALA